MQFHIILDYYHHICDKQLEKRLEKARADNRNIQKA